MAEMWRCGDCGCVWDAKVLYCTHTLDDYLSLRGGSIEAAIALAVEKAIKPAVREAERRLRLPLRGTITTWESDRGSGWRWKP